MAVNALEFDRSLAALKRLLAWLFMYVGLADDVPSAMQASDGATRAALACREPFVTSRRVCDLVLKLLVPVESATRRLIVVLAANLPVPALPESTAGDRSPAATAAAPDLSPNEGGGPETSVPRPPPFSLVDPRKSFDWFYYPKPDATPPWPGPGPERASPFDRLDASSLRRRVAALAHALDDLPAQALRLVRWKTRQLKARAAGKFVIVDPLRGGPPPGSLAASRPRREEREEHDVLRRAHSMAWYAVRYPDTS